MQAKRTILTHFSQRYPKLPNLGLFFFRPLLDPAQSFVSGWESAPGGVSGNDQQKEERSRVVIAFDYMKVQLIP